VTLASRPVVLLLAIVVAVAGALAALLVPRLAGETTPAARPAAPRAALAAAAASVPAPAAATPDGIPPEAVAAPAEPGAAPVASPVQRGAATPALPLVETASAARHVRPVAVRLPVASRWSLPPIITLTATRDDDATGRRALHSAKVALAPAVSRALAAGADPSALAPLVRVPRSALGPVLVLGLHGRTVRAQATSLPATRQTLEALRNQPEGVRPTILLEAAPADVADQSGPPPPRAGELATLVPIYQAAGSEYGVDWRILAAINLVETGLGTNVNVSSAGAVGWMQFMPGTWRMYGRDASGDGIADPNDPYDAIYSAASYLEAAGARTDIGRAIFAYNHADWYVRMVLAAARNLPEPFRSAG
jgi:soluble lytic murein transglycosylase-like protein